MQQICNNCKITKDINEFSLRKDKGKEHYRKECKMCRCEKEKKRRQQNIEKFREKDKIYYESKKEEIIKKNKEYSLKNSEKIKAQKKVYYLKNKSSIKLYHKNNKCKRNKYLQNRRKTDTMFRINNSLRVRIKELLMKQKDDAYSTLLGCSKKDLKVWIEHQFNDKIDWNNYGTEWHIDHVYPVKSFDLRIKEERMKCFNWSNLRPLSKEENMSKSSKILQADIEKHAVIINEFVKTNPRYQASFEKD